MVKKEKESRKGYESKIVSQDEKIGQGQVKNLVLSLSDKIDNIQLDSCNKYFCTPEFVLLSDKIAYFP